MPVFISYSRKDKEFALKLSKLLVARNHYIWIDEWEVNAGESLISTIQDAVQNASVLLAIFSKASMKSIWCKKEVNAGIQRELEERKVVVIPVKLDNCRIPLFLREKRYADFRTNFDEGFSTVDQALAKP